MEYSGKQGISSDASSEEHDRADQVKGGDDTAATTTKKRSYECSFCKRGFTNAQALGGHMNIHRKDRAKAKQPTGSSVDRSEPMNEDYMSLRYVHSIPSTEPSNYCYPVLEAAHHQRNNYQMYFQPQPVSSPRLPYGYFDSDFLAPNSRPQSNLSTNEELLGANLSLQIGPTTTNDGEVMKEDDLDLELRLGHDP